MKIRIFYIVFAILQPLPSWSQNNSTSGNCSPIISNNTGNITFTCTNNAALEISINQKYKELTQAIKTQNLEVSGLRKKLQKSDNNQVAIDNIKQSLADFRHNYSTILKNITIMKEQIFTDIKNLTLNPSATQEFINNLNYSITSELERVDQSIWELDARTLILENQVQEMRDNITKLMPLLFNGSIKDTVGFWSITTGINIADNQNKNPAIAIGYEWINPSIRFNNVSHISIFTELTKNKITISTTASTFPGVSQIKTENTTDLLMAHTGIRIFSSNDTNGVLYKGAKFGVGLKNRQFSGTAFLGYEYFKRSARIGIESFISKISGLKQDSILFDPWGNSRITTQYISKNMIGLNFRVSFQ